MAWIVWHRTKSGTRLARVHWRDAEGHHRSRSTKTSDPALAERFRKAVEAQQAGQGARPPAPVALATGPLLDGFLDHLRAKGDAPDTVAYYREKIDHVFKGLGPSVLAWDRFQFEAYLARQAKWSARRKGMAINAAKFFLVWAREMGLAVPDFVGGLKPPRRQRIAVQDERALSLKEAKALLKAAKKHRLEVPINLALLAGLSIGDIRRLTWAQIDAKKGVIHGRRKKTKVALWVPIPAPLKRLLKRPEKAKADDLVCAKLWKSKGSVGRDLAEVYKAAGLERAGWKRLRHTYATLLSQEAHADVATVGSLISHARGSPQTLVYTHTSEQEVRKAVAGLERRLR